MAEIFYCIRLGRSTYWHMMLYVTRKVLPGGFTICSTLRGALVSICSTRRRIWLNTLLVMACHASLKSLSFPSSPSLFPQRTTAKIQVSYFILIVHNLLNHVPIVEDVIRIFRSKSALLIDLALNNLKTHTWVFHIVKVMVITSR